MAKTAKDYRNKAITISVSPELFEKIDKLAIASGVSRSSYISVLVAESIRQKDIVNKALDDFPSLLAEKLKEFVQTSDADTLS